MDRERAIQFCHRYAEKKFYQPIVFVPGVIEIQGKWNEATKELANVVLDGCEGKSVLDLGCMHGYFLHEAKRRGATKTVGVDHDIVEMGIAKEINDIFDDGTELFFEDIKDYVPYCSFDIILMMNVIHVLDNPSGIISRYIKMAKERLVIEYREDHDRHFPQQIDYSMPSPRSAGYRKLSHFLVQPN